MSAPRRSGETGTTAATRTACPDQPYLPPPSPLSVARRPLDKPHHNRSRAEVIDDRRGSRHRGRTTPAPAPVAPPPPDHGDARPEGAERAATTQPRSDDGTPPRMHHPYGHCSGTPASRTQYQLVPHCFPSCCFL
jgi:hypothetical protein